MATILQEFDSSFSIFGNFCNHPAWYGNISGLAAEKMLRDQKVPYLYLLRQGEKSDRANEENYYVTYLDSDLKVRHQPLVVTEMASGIFFENGSGYGPSWDDVTIEDIIPKVIYCQKGECAPFLQ